MSSSIKLDLQYVTDIIGDEYKQWKLGDKILIKAQTGAGKTWFIKNELIPYVDDYSTNALLLTNRVNLSRQVKSDLLKKYNKDIPKNIEELDNITKISSVTILSYQAINEIVINEGDFSFDNFDFLICDECHYFLKDSWSGQTEISFNKLIKEEHDATIIFISATMDMLEQEIESSHRKHNKNRIGTYRTNLWKYDTNRDYTYLKPHTYTNPEILLEQILKDKRTKNKWLIFVNNKNYGNELKRELEYNDISCSFIYRGCRNKKELNNIIKNERFECKVLITTTILDNGINLFDEKIKNIVVTTWDYKIELIQCIGRIRFKNLAEAYPINLYLDKKTRKQIHGKITSIENSIKEIELLKNNPEEFKKKYARKLNKLPNYIYLDQNNNYQYDELSYKKLLSDCRVINGMRDNYYDDISVNRALKSLGLRKNSKNIVEVIDLDKLKQEKEIDNLEVYIKSLINKPLDKQHQQELIEKINIRDEKGRLKKSYEIISQYINDNYNLRIKKDRIYIDGKQIRVWILKR